MTKTRALPQALEDDISVSLLPDGTIQVKLTDAMTPPPGITLVNDPGRSTQKIAVIKNEKTILLQKLTSYLTEISSEKFVSAGGTDFLAKQEQKASTKNRLSFECPDETGRSRCYAFGTRAAKHGGSVGLGESKTVNLRLRIMASLTAWGVTQGEVNLGVAIPFASTDQFRKERINAEEQLSGELTWSVKGNPCKVNVVRKLIVPESYFGERLAWIAKQDAETSTIYPCFQGFDRFIADMGFQSFNLIVIDSEDLFDPDLSVSLDYGVSRYYKAVAERIGVKNFEAPGFIQAINTASLAQECPFQVPGTTKTINLSEPCQIEMDNFFNGLRAQLLEFQSNDSILDSIRHFTAVGGGAYLFGTRLCEFLENSEGFVSPLPDVANAIGMAMAMGDLLS